MRIIHWTDFYPLPGEMHQGHAVRELVRALRCLHEGVEHDVYLFFPCGVGFAKWFAPRYRTMASALRSGPYEAGLHYKRMLLFPKALFSSQTNPFYQTRILPGFAQQFKCDFIHVHSCYNLAYGAVLTGQKLGIPVVATIRREQEMGDLPVRRVKLLSEAMKRVDAVISPSAHLAQKCRSATGREVQIIPSGTNTLFDEKPPSNLSRKRRVLFVGTLDANKGIKALLQTSLKLFANGINFELFIVGAGFIGEGPLRGELEKLAQGHPKVKFLGRITAEEVREQMRQAQLLCVPSYTETFGLVYVEAMKQGLPVIGRRGTGIDGMGKAGVHYELIEKDEDLPSLLRDLLNDETRRLQLAAAGQRLAAKWTWRNSALQHIALFERLINSL